MIEAFTKKIPSSELILILVSGLKPIFLTPIVLLLKDSNLIIPLSCASSVFFLLFTPIPLGFLGGTHPEVRSRVFILSDFWTQGQHQGEASEVCRHKSGVGISAHGSAGANSVFAKYAEVLEY